MPPKSLNAYIAKEKLKRVYKAGAVFTKGKNEYFPIPATIIDLSSKIWISFRSESRILI